VRNSGYRLLSSDLKNDGAAKVETKMLLKAQQKAIYIST
jgi:hypothetical protein